MVSVTWSNCMCSAITLGRVAWVCPGQIAPHLAHFVGPWCYALRNIRDDIEKEHAFLGLCALLRANPEVALLSALQLCHCTCHSILPSSAALQACLTTHLESLNESKDGGHLQK